MASTGPSRLGFPAQAPPTRRPGSPRLRLCPTKEPQAGGALRKAAEGAREPPRTKLTRDFDFGKQPAAGGEEGSARGVRRRGSGNAPPLRAGKQVAAEPGLLPAAVQPRPHSCPAQEHTQRFPSARPLPGLPWRSRSPSGGGLKAPSARSRRGRPAPELLPAERELCNRIVTDHGSGRKSEGPQVCESEGFFHSAEHAETDPGFQGGGMRSFRTLECGESKTLPTGRHTTPRLRERVQGLCAPDFSQRSAPLRQV